MQKLVVLAVFIAFVAAQTRVCLPPEFTTDEIVHDQKNGDLFGSRVYFSHKLQKERIDVNSVYHNEKPDGEKFQFLLDYPKRKIGSQVLTFEEVWYEVKYAQGTANCTQHPLTGKLEERCLSKNAHHRGKITLAGVVTCENYVERVDDDKVHLDILIAENINTPIRVLARKGKDFEVREFWNFKESVHHDSFVVPTVCTTMNQGNLHLTPHQVREYARSL